MIKIGLIEISGFKGAVKGMRNPKNSWDLSDSNFEGSNVWIGNKDLILMKKLLANGTDDHSKFMRMIHVQADVEAPLYWWKEFDTYKVGTVADSCSTMHKIHSRALTMNDFSHEHLQNLWKRQLQVAINLINDAILEYNALQDPAEKKQAWWQIIQLLPTSFNQLRTVDLNYAVIRNMYHARKNHKLNEWHDFCRWVETLPYSELITKSANDLQNELFPRKENK